MKLETELDLARELARNPISRYRTERAKWEKRKAKRQAARMAAAQAAFVEMTAKGDPKKNKPKPKETPTP